MQQCSIWKCLPTCGCDLCVFQNLGPFTTVYRLPLWKLWVLRTLKFWNPLETWRVIKGNLGWPWKKWIKWNLNHLWKVFFGTQELIWNLGLRLICLRFRCKPSTFFGDYQCQEKSFRAEACGKNAGPNAAQILCWVEVYGLQAWLEPVISMVNHIDTGYRYRRYRIPDTQMIRHSFQFVWFKKNMIPKFLVPWANLFLQCSWANKWPSSVHV